MVGKVVLEGQISGDVQRVNTSKLANGIYTISITDGQKTIVKKISKQ